MVYISSCIPAYIQLALADFPETLDETYERSLREINRANWEFAHRLFQFVAVASRPLRVEELVDLLAFDFEAGPIPKFHEDWRLEDPVDAVLSACSSLLTVVDVEGSLVIQFSHFSVKQFLTSARLAEANDIILRRYHVSMTPAHTLASLACLGILLHLDKDAVTRNSLKDFPLAEYAAEYWVGHARFEDVSRNVDDGMKQLFDPSKPHLSICLWIHNPEFPWNERAERPLPARRSHLHYAASLGLHSIVNFLVIEHSQDVHSRILIDNATPLHLASRYGHIEVARILLEFGADLTAQNRDWETPLHVALRDGQVEVACMLLEFGADPTAQNENGDTLLHVASRVGQVQVAHMLLDRVADLAAQNEDGETPLHLALLRGHVEVAGMLIKRGADLTAKNKDGETPLCLALRVGHVEVACMLIEHGADVSTREEDGWTPLHLASRDGQVEIACMLIKHEAHVSAQEEDGWTPLHLASFNGQVEIARLLIEHGADVTTKNKDRETPLDLVSTPDRDEEPSQRGAEVARILLEHSAKTRRNANGLHSIWGCGIRGLEKFHAFLLNMIPIQARA